MINSRIAHPGAVITVPANPRRVHLRLSCSIETNWQANVFIDGQADYNYYGTFGTPNNLAILLDANEDGDLVTRRFIVVVTSSFTAASKFSFIETVE